MPNPSPHKHHYVPQFYLRNFAIDVEKKKIGTVAKHGDRAIWSVRSIKGLGFNKDFYVHMRQGTPISVEENINKKIETPLSQSDTWLKITSGRSDALDRTDKPILYALIRHLEARTPHYHATATELGHLASMKDSSIPFTDEEQEFYAWIRENPKDAKEFFNFQASSLEWTEKSFRGAALSVLRSPIPLRTSSIPVMSMPAPSHPALSLELPGMIPYQNVLPLDRTTVACLVLGDFDDAFLNIEIGTDVAQGFNRHRVAHFAHFEHVRHLITDRKGLLSDMTWAPFKMAEESERRVVFKRDVHAQ